MIFAQLVLLPLLLLFTWGYLATRPGSRRGTGMLVFDAVVIALAAALSGAAGWWIAALEPVRESAIWVTVKTTLTTFHVFPAVLLTGWYLRKRWFVGLR